MIKEKSEKSLLDRILLQRQQFNRFSRSVSNLLILRHCGSFLSSHSRAPRRFAPPVSRPPRVFVYANALQAVISSHERWATAKPATNDILYVACTIGPCPILEIRRRERKSSLRKRCVDASIMHTRTEFRKSRVFACGQCVSASRRTVIRHSPRDRYAYLTNIWYCKRNLEEIKKKLIKYVYIDKRTSIGSPASYNETNG